jgi:hypothetical protein
VPRADVPALKGPWRAQPRPGRRALCSPILLAGMAGAAGRKEAMRWNWRSATSVLRNIQYTLAERRFRERQRWTDRRMKCARAPAILLFSKPKCPRRAGGSTSNPRAHPRSPRGVPALVQVGQLAPLLPQTGHRRRRTGGGQHDDGVTPRAP